MKKILSLVIIFVLVLSACSSESSSEGDDKLIIWNFYEGVPKFALDDYTAESGVETEFVTIGWEDYQTKLNTVLGTAEAPDLVVLDRSFMGQYVTSDNFVAFEDIMEDSSYLDAYKENTDLGTQGPGIVEDTTKAIGWENTASVFYYRSDIASKCLDINSPEEMEAATTTVDDYYALYDQLQSSSDETCNIALNSEDYYEKGVLGNAGAYLVENDTYTITSDFDDALNTIKDNNDSKLVYSPQQDKDQVIAGAKSDLWFGTIAPAWNAIGVKEYEQPGQWSISQTPLKYSDGGSFLAATNTADTDLVEDYLNSTILNEDWIIENMQDFGSVGNSKIMTEYLDTQDGSDEYFSGQNVAVTLAEASASIDDYVPVSAYDSGIYASVTEVVDAYAVDGTLATTEDAKIELESKLNSLYPELEIVIE